MPKPVLRQNARFTLTIRRSAVMITMPSDDASNTFAHSASRCSSCLSRLIGVKVTSTASRSW